MSKQHRLIVACAVLAVVTGPSGSIEASTGVGQVIYDETDGGMRVRLVMQDQIVEGGLSRFDVQVTYPGSAAICPITAIRVKILEKDLAIESDDSIVTLEETTIDQAGGTVSWAATFAQIPADFSDNAGDHVELFPQVTMVRKLVGFFSVPCYDLRHDGRGKDKRIPVVLDDNYEDNDSRAAAINLGSQGIGTNVIAVDEDWYRITVPESHTDTSVTIEFYSGATDLLLRLYTSAGVLIDSGLEELDRRRIERTLSGGASYYFRITRNGSVSPAFYHLVVAFGAAPRPARPTGFVASTASHTSIDLLWTGDSTVEMSRFRVERAKTSGTGYTFVSDLPVDARSFRDQNLNCDTTYFYRLRAERSSDGQTSEWAGEAAARTSRCPAASAPAAPTSPAASSSSPFSVSVSWQDNSTDETGFTVQRSSLSGSGFVSVAQVASGSTAYSDTSVACGSIYFYRIRSDRAGDQMSSDWTSEASVRTPSCSTPLAMPSNLSARAASATSIDLFWSDQSSSETAFRIERSNRGDGNFTGVGVVDAEVSSFSDHGLTCGTLYYFRVRSERATDGVSSEWSAATSARTNGCGAGGLAAPTNLSAATVVNASLDLSWVDQSSDESSFAIERATGSGGFAFIARVSAGAQSYRDTAVSCAMSYWYRVRAERAADSVASGWNITSAVSTVVCGGPLPPATPGNGAAVAASPTAIDITWSDESSNESFFEIEQSFSPQSGFVGGLVIIGNSTSIRSPNLVCATTYYYRIRAARQVGAGQIVYSEWSSVVSGRTSDCVGAKPVAPSALSATLTVARALRLAWTDNSADESGFRIERAIGTSGAFVYHNEVFINDTTWTDTYVECAMAYSYRIRAIRLDDNLHSDWTAPTVPVLIDCDPKPDARLTVTRAGAGIGTVTSDVPGISCGTDCDEQYPFGTTVTLAAQARSDGEFLRWDGDADCVDGRVTMTMPLSCRAVFRRQAHFFAWLTVTGTGSGTVNSGPTGIACRADSPFADCIEDFRQGTRVTLHPVADLGSVFDGWSGDSHCDEQLTMDVDTYCTATFRAVAPQNDTCSAATEISSATFIEQVNTTLATTAAGDPFPLCGTRSRANSVWYRFTSQLSGTVHLTTGVSDYSTIVQVFKGPCGALVPVVGYCSANGNLSFPTGAGQTYVIMVSSSSEGSGLLQFETEYEAFELPFTDMPLVKGGTPLRTVHITELRWLIDQLRRRYGLSPFAWTDASIVAGVTIVKAVHFIELRTALASAYAAAGRNVPQYLDPAPMVNTPISARVVEEIRGAIAAIW